MKYSVSILIPIALMFISSWGHTQGNQSLIEPELEVFDLYNMEPRTNPLGLEVRSVGLSSLRMAQVIVKKGQSTPSHNHAFEQMVLILEGKAMVTSGDKEFVLEPGEMFTAPAFVHHTYTGLEDTIAIEAFGPGGSFTPNTSVINNP